MRRANIADDSRLDMTPMIDCVFQLLIFFIIALKPVDIIAHLDVSRSGMVTDPIDVEQVEIIIRRDAMLINNKVVTAHGMEQALIKLGGLGDDQRVVIKCAADSRHADLVTVLDSCAVAGLRQLAVVSL